MEIKIILLGQDKDLITIEIENVNIEASSHNISPFNIIEGAYIIQNSYKNFPEGSIHIIGVDAETTTTISHLAVYANGHYFICADNGILSLISSKINPEKIIEINIHNHKSTSFTVLDVFVKVAAHIYRGGSIDLVGKRIQELKELYDINPIVNEKNKEITGNVAMHRPNYENVFN